MNFVDVVKTPHEMGYRILGSDSYVIFKVEAGKKKCNP